MRKSFKELLVITAMLCLFLLPGLTGIKAHAATGVLYNGRTFNKTIKSFVDANSTHNTRDYTIKKIIFAKAPSKPAKSLIPENIGDGVTVYYDSAEQTVYVCSNSKIKFNSDCDSMFIDFYNVEEINFGSNVIDTSEMKDASYMFRCCSSLVNLDLSQFRTPNLVNMCQMFHCCFKLKKINVSTFDTSNVTDMQSVFMSDSALESLDLRNWNTSKVNRMFQMFEGLRGLKTLDLSNFDTRNVTDMYRMFNGCRNLKTLNISSFRTPKLINVQEMFTGCRSLEYLNLSGFDLSKVADADAGAFLGSCISLKYVDAPCKISKNFDYAANSPYVKNCGIGKVAIDDNKDGKADSSATYSYFIKANKSHRYMFLDAIEREKEKKDPVDPIKPPVPVPSDPTTPEKKDGDVTPVSSEESAANQSGYDLPANVIIDGVTYHIDINGQATVTNIASVRKAKINTVTYKNVEFPVTSISANAAKGNRKLSTLTVGNNVTKIGKKAFYKCKKLKKVTIKANKKLKVEKNAFKKINKDGTIKVKSLKGNAKKKVVKSIKKQTDAVVK
ncbi:BspA family leucine-rich repeat surface protein [Butyrivibrio sp. XPD2002]|uniref:BspA family leucine-rich repeat surface protein n=1 Tax=Butyrivibrio sp. XPD2002 TaxID=1280665 RepID=UPI0004189145|nr:BspA family leucine-rich repeat surface protein [Butyrivibrio sp. XPD2002]